MDFSHLTRTQIARMRRGLITTGRDLCLGEMCKGKVKPMKDFCRNRHLCKQCNTSRVQKVYNTHGRNARDTEPSMKLFGCYECRHSNPSHLIRVQSSTQSTKNANKQFAPQLGDSKYVCLWCDRLHNRSEKSGEKPMTKNVSNYKGTDGRICNGILCEEKYLSPSSFYQRKITSTPYGNCKKCIASKNQIDRSQNQKEIIKQKIKKGKCTYCNKKVHSRNEMCFDLVSAETLTKLPNYGRISKNLTKKIQMETLKALLVCCLCGCDKDIG